METANISDVVLDTGKK